MASYSRSKAVEPPRSKKDTHFFKLKNLRVSHSLLTSAATITQQPESAPDTTVVAPQSYQSLEQSGARVSGQVRCRDTHGSN